jgi:agmatine deiminase
MAPQKSSKPVTQAPGSAGYRMPAEWTPHRATWLAFPHHRTDFPGKLAATIHTFAEMARVISQGERVCLLVRDAPEEERARGVFEAAGVIMKNVDFIRADTNRSWTRDSMPIWVSKAKGGARVSKKPTPSDKIACKFRFDGWSRYRDHRLDDAAGVHVARSHSSRHFRPQAANGAIQVLEGGSIDVDEKGTLLTTSSCLVTSKRARFSGGKLLAEQTLKSVLGVKKILWLPAPPGTRRSAARTARARARTVGSRRSSAR